MSTSSELYSEFSSSSTMSSDRDEMSEKVAEGVSEMFVGDKNPFNLNTDQQGGQCHQHQIQLKKEEDIDANEEITDMASTSSLPERDPLASSSQQEQLEEEEEEEEPLSPPSLPRFESLRPMYPQEFLLQQLEINKADFVDLNLETILDILGGNLTTGDTGSVLAFLLESETRPAQTVLCAFALALFGVEQNLKVLKELRLSIEIDISVNKDLFIKVIDCVELLHASQNMSLKFLLSTSYMNFSSDNLQNSIPEHVLQAVLCRLPTQEKIVQQFKADVINSVTDLLSSEFLRNPYAAKGVSIRYTTAFERWVTSFWNKGKSFLSVFLEGNRKWRLGTSLFRIVYDEGKSQVVLNLHDQVVIGNGIDSFNKVTLEEEETVREMNLWACNWSTVSQIVTILYDYLWNIHISTPCLTIVLMKGLESIGASRTIETIMENVDKFAFSSKKDEILIKATFGDDATINELARCITTQQRNNEVFRKEYVFQLDDKTFGKLLVSNSLQISSIEKYKLIVEWAGYQGGQEVFDPLATVASEKSQIEFKKQYHHVDFNGLLQYAHMIFFQKFINQEDITKCT